MAKAWNKRKRKERPQRIHTSRDCCMFRIISSLGYEEKIPTQWPLCIVVWSKNFTIRLFEIHARTHTHIHTSTFTLVVLYSHLLECFIIYWKCDRSIARYNISTYCLDDDLITILIFLYTFFYPFQDKIRLIQDDLESERELRQRVSSIQIIFWPDQINPHEYVLNLIWKKRPFPLN